MAAPNLTPLGDPPDGNGGPSGITNVNARTVPEWMDRQGMFGQRIVLLLQPLGNGVLPNNPFLVGKSIEQTCGKIEVANTEEGGTKYVLKTRSQDQARKLLAMSKLIDGTEVEVITHPRQNVCRCVVSCREAIDLSEDDLVKELSPQGVVNARRFTKREGNNRVNTATVCLTLNGTVVPKHIWFGPLRIATRLFYPSPMLCFKCCDYGHTSKNCKKEDVCCNCSLQHTNEPSEGGRCTLDPYCKHCKGAHPPTSKVCPKYKREEAIIKIQVETGVTFAEARREYEKRNQTQPHGTPTHAEVAGAQKRLEAISKENEKDNEIRLLKEEIEKLKRTTSELDKDEIINSLRYELQQTKRITDALMEKLRKTKAARNDTEIDTEKETSENEDSPKQAKMNKGQKATLKNTISSQPETIIRRGRGRPRKTAIADAGKFDAEMHSN